MSLDILLKKKTFKHKYAKQILAVVFISLCQTKECFNMGHSCIIIADPYIMSSLPCFTVWHSGNGNHVGTCCVRGIAPSRR